MRIPGISTETIYYLAVLLLSGYLQDGKLASVLIVCTLGSPVIYSGIKGIKSLREAGLPSTLPRLAPSSPVLRRLFLFLAPLIFLLGYLFLAPLVLLCMALVYFAAIALLVYPPLQNSFNRVVAHLTPPPPEVGNVTKKTAYFEKLKTDGEVLSHADRFGKYPSASTLTKTQELATRSTGYAKVAGVPTTVVPVHRPAPVQDKQARHLKAEMEKMDQDSKQSDRYNRIFVLLVLVLLFCTMAGGFLHLKWEITDVRTEILVRLSNLEERVFKLELNMENVLIRLTTAEGILSHLETEMADVKQTLGKVQQTVDAIRNSLDEIYTTLMEQYRMIKAIDASVLFVIDQLQEAKVQYARIFGYFATKHDSRVYFGLGCFPPGTLIRVDEIGTEVPVEMIFKGSLVWSPELNRKSPPNCSWS